MICMCEIAPEIAITAVSTPRNLASPMAASALFFVAAANGFVVLNRPALPVTHSRPAHGLASPRMAVPYDKTKEGDYPHPSDPKCAFTTARSGRL